MSPAQNIRLLKKMNPRLLVRRLLHFSLGTLAPPRLSSPLLNLPLDLLETIADELPWPEKVVLSQTCRSFWLQLHDRCVSTLRKATTLERHEYLNSLGKLLPDHFWCAHCFRVHPVDPKDTPISYSAASKRSNSCVAPEPRENYVFFNYEYKIALRHVQLALKYSKMKDVHQRYRMDILKGYSSFDGHLGPYIAAKPIITRGRLLLKVEYLFSGAAKHQNVEFCPHHTMRTFFDPDNDLNALQRDAFRHLNDCYYQRTHSCIACPSDFSVMINDKKLLVSVWYDLGTGDSLEDLYWRSHIWDTKDFFGHIRFPYEHGSVKRMYEESEILEPPQKAKSNLWGTMIEYCQC